MKANFDSAGDLHDFGRSLAMSHSASDWPGWEPLYRKFFPTFLAMHDHRQDGDHQRAGIDRTVVLQNAKVLYIDEKVRGRNRKTGKVYGDILLEVFSDKARLTPGWAVKPVQADYIAYLIAPLGVCHLMPVLQLQLAFSRNRDAWISQFGTREAHNRTWITVSVPVPVKVLYPAIGGCLHADCEPFDVTEHERAA